MFIVVDPHSGVPVYRQIIERVRFLVAAGLAPAGEELPSTRVLSQELGVNPMTVSKAYSALEEAGLVTRRPGLPLVVSGRAGEAAAPIREERLRVALVPAVVAAHQLGVGEDEAVEIFRALLAETAGEEAQKV